MIYLDDTIPYHPKIVAAGELSRDAPWLWLAILGYCRHNLTSGLISASMIPATTPLYRRAALKALVEVGLIEPVGMPGKQPSAYQLHDYGDWNNREDSERENRSAKARRAARARWANRAMPEQCPSMPDNDA